MCGEMSRAVRDWVSMATNRGRASLYEDKGGSIGIVWDLPDLEEIVSEERDISRSFGLEASFLESWQ